MVVVVVVLVLVLSSTFAAVSDWPQLRPAPAHPTAESEDQLMLGRQRAGGLLGGGGGGRGQYIEVRGKTADCINVSKGPGGGTLAARADRRLE